MDLFRGKSCSRRNEQPYGKRCGPGDKAIARLGEPEIPDPDPLTTAKSILWKMIDRTGHPDYNKIYGMCRIRDSRKGKRKTMPGGSTEGFRKIHMGTISVSIYLLVRFGLIVYILILELTQPEALRGHSTAIAGYTAGMVIVNGAYVLFIVWLLNGLAEAADESEHFRRARFRYMLRMGFSALGILLESVFPALIRQEISLPFTTWRFRLTSVAAPIFLEMSIYALLDWLAQREFILGMRVSCRNYGGDGRLEKHLERTLKLQHGCSAVLLVSGTAVVSGYLINHWLRSMRIAEALDAMYPALIVTVLAWIMRLLVQARLVEETKSMAALVRELAR